MYSHQEIQNASSLNLQDYILQPLLHTADLAPLSSRLSVLIDSADDSDSNEKEQLNFLAERMIEIFTAKTKNHNITNSMPNLPAFIPKQQSIVNFLEVIPEELIQKILQELTFNERLSFTLVSKQSKKIINEMPLLDKYIFIKDIFMIAIDQLNQEYDLAILPDQVDVIKPGQDHECLVINPIV
ncbi:MAG: F-box protein [Tatlockia sp.]|nr:F-box protein [Tatlockia sp.]